jgi:hypothetical protein
MIPNIEFIELEKVGKTRRFGVISKHTNERLGNIVFYGGWRQFVFEPLPNTRFSNECLKEIANFEEELTKEWKQLLNKNKVIKNANFKIMSFM